MRYDDDFEIDADESTWADDDIGCFSVPVLTILFVLIMFSFNSCAPLDLRERESGDVGQVWNGLTVIWWAMLFSAPILFALARRYRAQMRSGPVRPAIIGLQSVMFFAFLMFANDPWHGIQSGWDEIDFNTVLDPRMLTCMHAMLLAAILLLLSRPRQNILQIAIEFLPIVVVTGMLIAISQQERPSPFDFFGATAPDRSIRFAAATHDVIVPSILRAPDRDCAPASRASLRS